MCRKGLEVAADDPQLKALGDQIRPQAVKEAEGHKEKGNVSFQVPSCHCWWLEEGGLVLWGM